MCTCSKKQPLWLTCVFVWILDVSKCFNCGWMLIKSLGGESFFLFPIVKCTPPNRGKPHLGNWKRTHLGNRRPHLGNRQGLGWGGWGRNNLSNALKPNNIDANPPTNFNISQTYTLVGVGWGGWGRNNVPNHLNTQHYQALTYACMYIKHRAYN